MPTPGCQVSTWAHFLYLTYCQRVTGIRGSNPLLVGPDVNKAGLNFRHKLSYPMPENGISPQPVQATLEIFFNINYYVMRNLG